MKLWVRKWFNECLFGNLRLHYSDTTWLSNNYLAELKAMTRKDRECTRASWFTQQALWMNICICLLLSLSVMVCCVITRVCIEPAIEKCSIWEVGSLQFRPVLRSNWRDSLEQSQVTLSNCFYIYSCRAFAVPGDSGSFVYTKDEEAIYQLLDVRRPLECLFSWYPRYSLNNSVDSRLRTHLRETGGKGIGHGLRWAIRHPTNVSIRCHLCLPFCWMYWRELSLCD